jgi:hypothetical protein
MMPAMMTIAGSAVDSSETARPWMTLVPWPVTEAWAIETTGRLPGAGVVFGDDDDQQRHDEADEPQANSPPVKVAPCTVPKDPEPIISVGDRGDRRRSTARRRRSGPCRARP